MTIALGKLCFVLITVGVEAVSAGGVASVLSAAPMGAACTSEQAGLCLVSRCNDVLTNNTKQYYRSYIYGENKTLRVSVETIQGRKVVASSNEKRKIGAHSAG